MRVGEDGRWATVVLAVHWHYLTMVSRDEGHFVSLDSLLPPPYLYEQPCLSDARDLPVAKHLLMAAVSLFRSRGANSAASLCGRDPKGHLVHEVD